MAKKRSRFVRADEVTRIDLGEGDWVEVPERFSYEDVLEISDKQKESKDANELGMSVLPLIIKKWNLEGEDGKVADISIENLKRLDFQTISTIVSKVLPKITVAKKKGKS